MSWARAHINFPIKPEAHDFFYIIIVSRKLIYFFVSSSQPVSFNWKVYLSSFLYYPTFRSKLFHFFTYPQWSWMQYLTSFLSHLTTIFLNHILFAVLNGLLNNRTSFNFIPSTPLTHCIAALLRIVNGVWHKELGRRTGRKEEMRK